VTQTKVTVTIRGAKPAMDWFIGTSASMFDDEDKFEVVKVEGPGWTG
jgi:hypothetical protein